LVSKPLLDSSGILTPRYLAYEGVLTEAFRSLRFPVLAKPRFEDASIGIDQDSVFKSPEDLRERVSGFYDRYGPLIVEEYIPGREFNVSLFGYPLAQVMPIAEMSFEGFPEGLYPIVGYRAKWDTGSFEYGHTVRVFPGDLPEDLKEKVHQVALDCFRYFMVRDYGRVDMRVDPLGKVYVLEINANPCISPDSGFPAALAQTGIEYEDFVRHLVDFVRSRENGVAAGNRE
jgi:D-alanine-D-alanine ligase